MPERNDMDSLGLFSAPPSINIGAPYATNKGPTNDDRFKGMQFKTNPCKRGPQFARKTADVTFSQFMTLSVGTPYVELGKLQQRDRNENAKKQIVPQAFRPSHPPQKPNGSGAHYGALGKYPNMKTTDEYDKRPAKKGEERVSLKNIITSPPKRGTYGFVGLNIGGKAEGVAGEFRYASEPFKVRPATAGDKPKPFVPSSPAKKGTYGYMKLNINGADKPHGFNGEYSYAVEGLASARSGREKVQPDSMKPFYPSQPPKKGGGFYGTMRWAGQEYKEDPEAEKFAKIVAERKAAREKYGNLVFRPSSTPKSMRTISVTNHPRNQDGGHPAAVNAQIFRSRRAGGGG